MKRGGKERRRRMRRHQLTDCLPLQYCQEPTAMSAITGCMHKGSPTRLCTAVSVDVSPCLHCGAEAEEACPSLSHRRMDSDKRVHYWAGLGTGESRRRTRWVIVIRHSLMDWMEPLNSLPPGHEIVNPSHTMAYGRP